MQRAFFYFFLFIISLALCACVSRQKTRTQPDDEPYPYKNAVEYRKANQKPEIVEKKGYPLPPKPESEQDEKLVFPGIYIPDTGKGKAVLQKLKAGDYFFQTSISYGNSATTFEATCYQIENKIICPIDYDMDEDFNPVEAYIELDQINPGQLRLKAYYTLPGLFGKGLPELFRRKLPPPKKAGNFVKPSIGKLPEPPSVIPQ